MKIKLLIAFLISVAVLLFYFWPKLSFNYQIGGNTSVSSTPTPNGQLTEADVLTKSFTFIEPENRIFSIPNLNNVQFQVIKVAKAIGDITKTTGCTGQSGLLYGLFIKYLYFGSSGVCINSPLGDKTAFVAIDLQVTNSNSKILEGDFFNLFYNEKIGSQNYTRTAEKYLSFRSYSISPFQVRSIRLGFLVPEDQNQFSLIYSATGNPGKTSLGFTVDFNNKTIK